jgi:hypothetical protein
VRALALLAVLTAPQASPAGLSLFIDRRPSESEVARNFTGARHEPKWGCYLGAYIDLDDSLRQTYRDRIGRDRRLPEEFEAKVGKPHASYFFYLGYGRPVPDDWVSRLAMEGKMVHIAFEPNRGLEYVRDDSYLRQFADDLRATGARVFLRFASEMNGPWVGYHGDPALYKEKFRLVAKVVRERAPNVAMVWCPYATPVGPIKSYYPGDDAVDWVGVNLYSVTYFNHDRRTPGKHVHPVDRIYAARKPVMIGEFGATHWSALEKKPQTAFAVRSIRGLYQALPRRYPRVKAVFYFNANNLALEHRQNNNYTVTQDPKVLAAYRDVTSVPYFLPSPPLPPTMAVDGVGLMALLPVQPQPVQEPVIPVAPMPLRQGERLTGIVRVSAWAKLVQDGARLEFRLGGRLVHTAASKAEWEVELDADRLPTDRTELRVDALVGKKRVASTTVPVTVVP